MYTVVFDSLMCSFKMLLHLGVSSSFFLLIFNLNLILDGMNAFFSQLFLSAVAHTLPSVGLFVSQKEASFIIWSVNQCEAQFGLYSVV